MIFNSVLSIYILNEHFTKYDVLAIALIISGCILCMFYTKSSDKVRDPEELMELYTSTGSISYFSVSIVYLAVVMWLNHTIRTKVKKGWGQIAFMGSQVIHINDSEKYSNTTKSSLLNVKRYDSD